MSAFGKKKKKKTNDPQLDKLKPENECILKQKKKTMYMFYQPVITRIWTWKRNCIVTCGLSIPGIGLNNWGLGRDMNCGGSGEVQLFGESKSYTLVFWSETCKVWAASGQGSIPCDGLLGDFVIWQKRGVIESTWRAEYKRSKDKSEQGGASFTS